MSLAADTRREVARYPFLFAALAAGTLNYTAAASFLDLDGDDEAIATALRRYATDLSDLPVQGRSVRVTMTSGVGPVDDPTAAILTVGDVLLGQSDGDLTAIVANGDVDAPALATVLGVLGIEGIRVEAAAVGDTQLAVVVSRRDGAAALRAVEGAFEAVVDVGACRDGI